VEVTFDIDANGILNVSAKDKASGREQKVTITASTNLNKAEIERLMKDAEAHKAEDEHRKSVVEVKNQADTIAYSAEKLIKDKGESEGAKLQEMVNALRQAINSEDINRMQSLMQEVQQAMQTVQQAPSNEAVPETEGNPQGDVVEGEFKEA
jgi:molecular chaperone DnaK